MNQIEMFAIVQKDNADLFTWFREKYEISPFAEGVVAIHKGSLNEVAEKAREFEESNKDKPVRLLSGKEIADFLK